jgi:hypothetical protein
MYIYLNIIIIALNFGCFLQILKSIRFFDFITYHSFITLTFIIIIKIK